MGDTIPLSYRSITGTTVTPGSILVSQTSSGSIGGWVAPPTVDLIDPATLPSLTSVVDSYNQLIWGLARASVITSDPYIQFGAAGDYGVNISINGTLAGMWTPGASAKLPISTILTQLNALCGPSSGVRFQYINKFILLFVASGTQVEFTDPTRTTRPGSAAHIMNRLIKGVPMSIPNRLTVIGEVFADAFSGIYPKPAAVTNTKTSASTNAVTVTWDPSTASDIVTYYVLITDGGSINTVIETTAQTYEFTGLAPATDYTVKIYTSTLYELSDPDTTIVRTDSPPLNIVYQIRDTGSNIWGTEVLFSPGNIFGLSIPPGPTNISINGIYFPNAIAATGGTITIKFQIFISDPNGTLISESNSVIINEVNDFVDYTTSQGAVIQVPKNWQTAHFNFPTSVTLTPGMIIVCAADSGSGTVIGKFEMKYPGNTPYLIQHYRYSLYDSTAYVEPRKTYIYALTS